MGVGRVCGDSMPSEWNRRAQIEIDRTIRGMEVVRGERIPADLYQNTQHSGALASYVHAFGGMIWDRGTARRRD